MHLMFVARGINHQMELWKSTMQAQYFPWQRELLVDKVAMEDIYDKNGKLIFKKGDVVQKKGEKESTYVQGSLRPIQLYEYVFPKESLMDVVGNMGCKNDDGNVSFYLPGHQKKMWALRKALGLAEVPEIPADFARNRVMQIPGVSVHPIGIKEDNVKEWHEFGYKQEML